MLPTILILAGRRPGAVDALAAAHDVADKCLVPVAGKPMLAHVLRAALASPAGQVIISSHSTAAVRDVVAMVAGADSGRVETVAASANLAESVLMALQNATFPVLVTTADACLLTAATVAEIDAGARAAGADAAVALARKADVLAVHPDGQRRFYGFSDVEVSNCNAYWLGSSSALRAVEAFRGGGQFIKKPMRVLKAFGLINLLRFRFGLGPLHTVFDRIGGHMRLRLVPLLVRDGATAIDVDNDRSLRVTQEVMAARGPGTGAGIAQAA